MDGWQPIETAPKDRDILVGRRDEGGWLCTVAFWTSDFDWWQLVSAIGYFRDPTHWMPLPEPPAP